MGPLAFAALFSLVTDPDRGFYMPHVMWYAMMGLMMVAAGLTATLHWSIPAAGLHGTGKPASLIQGADEETVALADTSATETLDTQLHVRA